MTKCTAALASTILLALALAAFTGSALAGNGNGNGTGSQDAAATPTVSATGSASQSPGNSANAPGQVKKDQSASGTATTQGGADANTNAEVLSAGYGRCRNGNSRERCKRNTKLSHVPSSQKLPGRKQRSRELVPEAFQTSSCDEIGWFSFNPCKSHDRRHGMRG